MNIGSSVILPPKKIDLWIWRFTDDKASQMEIQAFLSPEETARAARFVFPADKARFVGRRFHVRKVLGNYLSCAPGDIVFEHNGHGKPFLSPAHRSDLRFNLSHSEDVAVLGVTHGLELGVDVERVRPISEKVASRFFSRAECETLASIPADQADRSFHECWTGKEAFVKALGSGLSVPLDSFEVSFGPGSDSAIIRIGSLGNDEPRAWRLWRFEAAPGFLGAVAARTAGYPWELNVCSSG